MKTIIISVLRIALGFIFLWAFVDKLLGLGFATTTQNAWINGGSPTYGFLMYGTKGPLAHFFQSIAGSPVVDWLFMLGLLGVGVTLIINRFIVLGSIAGTFMVLLMYLAVLPPENNPLIDDHIIYALVFLFLGARAHAIAKKKKLFASQSHQ